MTTRHRLCPDDGTRTGRPRGPLALVDVGDPGLAAIAHRKTFCEPRLPAADRGLSAPSTPEQRDGRQAPARSEARSTPRDASMFAESAFNAGTRRNQPMSSRPSPGLRDITPIVRGEHLAREGLVVAVTTGSPARLRMNARSAAAYARARRFASVSVRADLSHEARAAWFASLTLAAACLYAAVSCATDGIGAEVRDGDGAGRRHRRRCRGDARDGPGVAA